MTATSFFAFQDFWFLAEDKKLQVEKNQTGKKGEHLAFEEIRVALAYFHPLEGGYVPTLLKRTLYHLDFTNSSSSASTLFNPALPGYSTQTDVSIKTESKQPFCVIWQLFLCKINFTNNYNYLGLQVFGKAFFSIWTISTWEGFFPSFPNYY